MVPKHSLFKRIPLTRAAFFGRLNLPADGPIEDLGRLFHDGKEDVALLAADQGSLMLHVEVLAKLRFAHTTCGFPEPMNTVSGSKPNCWQVKRRAQLAPGVHLLPPSN